MVEECSGSTLQGGGGGGKGVCLGGSFYISIFEIERISLKIHRNWKIILDCLLKI